MAEEFADYISNFCCTICEAIVYFEHDTEDDDSLGVVQCDHILFACIPVSERRYLDTNLGLQFPWNTVVSIVTSEALLAAGRQPYINGISTGYKYLG